MGGGKRYPSSKFHSTKRMGFPFALPILRTGTAEARGKSGVHSHEFPQPNQRDLPSPAFPAKINPFAPPPNQPYNLRVPACQEGRIAIVTDVGSECGGRGSDRCAGRIAGRALARERSAARQTNDAEAYGKTVWSWRPWLASSRRRRCGPDRARQRRQFADDGGKRNSSPRRARHKP
jgi:hypothetical protein